MDNRKNINVVLDLDNTCIYSHEARKLKQQSNSISKYAHHIMDDDYVVCERPGLVPFLDWLFENFNVMIWSAASPDYVDFIAKNIIEKRGKVEHIFNSEQCDESEKKYKKSIKMLRLLWDVKDLKGYGPYNTIIIDDLKYVTDPQPHNSIQIKRFVANQKGTHDSSLENVKQKLIDIKNRFDNTPNKKPSYQLI
uniref:FCP1 homology domain-containing protein n=1 Tax=viral metagenome TaxID=1070528 RepID=A0A6C0KEF0_9ZZZZ